MNQLIQIVNLQHVLVASALTALFSHFCLDKLRYVINTKKEESLQSTIQLSVQKHILYLSIKCGLRPCEDNTLFPALNHYRLYLPTSWMFMKQKKILRLEGIYFLAGLLFFGHTEYVLVASLFQS